MKELIIVSARYNKHRHLKVLLLADPDEEIILSYIDKCVLYECLCNNKLAGVAAVLIDSEVNCEIKNIAVAESFVRQGVGSALIRHIQRYASRGRVIVGTADVSYVALAFYRSNGFVPYERIIGFFTDNYDNPVYDNGNLCCDMILLEWRCDMNIELMKKLGNIDQIAGIRETSLLSGAGKGLSLIEVYNAAQLRFTVVPERCLDIYDFSYKGYNFSFHSKNGLVLGRNTAEEDFFNMWPGGILSTCGLTNVGSACNDGGMFHPVHGRIGSTPAHHIAVDEGWREDEYILNVSGEVCETRLYGMKLSLRRSISTGLFDKSITIEDTITNVNSADEEFMLLYHFNFGYPLLDESSTVVCPKTDVRPLNDWSDNYSTMNAPGIEAPQQLFLHTSSDTQFRAAVVNSELELAGYIKFETANLPYLCEWKNLAPHDYVLALEPCNCLGLGRVEERKNGTLQTLPAYSSITVRIDLGVLEGKTEIEDFCK